MASDSEPESGTADKQTAAPSSPPPSASDRPKKKKLKRPKPPVPQTEEEIDSPTKQTVGMLGVLGIMTVVMWAFARGGCNYHPPKETRVPRVVPTEELARDPKNAAVELQQRWLTHDYAGALELATGDLKAQVEKDKAGCNASCLGERKALSEKVLTSAVLLEANMMGALSRVSSVGLPGGPKVFLVRLERSGGIWKATARKVDDGVPLPAPPEPVAAHPLIPTTPAESASATPSAPLIHALPAHLSPTPSPSPSPSK